jgi:hypothetical protein
MIIDWRTISRRYLRSWFVVDLVSSTPVALIGLFSPYASELTLLQALRTMKIFRLTRLYDHNYFKEIEMKGYVPPSFVRLIKFLAVYLYCLHVITCFFWLMMTTYSSGAESVDDADALECDASVWGGISPEERSLTTSLAKRYILSMYWTLVVSLGNDFQPENLNQKMYSMATLFAGKRLYCVFCTYVERGWGWIRR